MKKLSLVYISQLKKVLRLSPLIVQLWKLPHTFLSQVTELKKKKHDCKLILTDRDNMQYDRTFEGRNSAKRVVLMKDKKN